MKKKNSKKIVLISFLIAAAGVMGTAAAYTGYTYKSNQQWDNLIYPGIKVDEVDLGGKTKDEALNLLKSKYGDVVLKKKIEIKANKNTYTIDYSKLNARYDIEEVVNDAYNFGKNLSIFEKSKTIKSGAEKEYKLTFSSENKYVDELIAQMEKDINKDPVDGKIQMTSSGNFKVTSDVKGYKLNTENLKKQINSNINGQISASTTTINAEIDTLNAKVTADKLATINTKISSYTTDYSSSVAERKNNIDLAAKSVSGKLLMPGDSFSFNDTVGQRTAARGYEKAHVIVNNKLEDDFGGGICQVSGTLYNTLMRANIKPTERQHHTFPSTYVPKGTDATVDWGNLDLKFVNTLNYPIYIEGIPNDRKLTFNIYSNSSLTSRTYDIVSDVVSTIQPSVKQVQDSSLPVGQQVWDQQGYPGYKVNVYKITYENGNQISKDLLYTDNYKKIDGVLRVGTKKN